MGFRFLGGEEAPFVYREHVSLKSEGGAFSCATSGLRGLRSDAERALLKIKGVDGRTVRQS